MLEVINNNHRYFIQYMIKKGISTQEEAFDFCKRISSDQIQTMAQFKLLVIEINRAISYQSLKIVFSTCEVTNEEMVVLLNTKNDDISRLQTTFSVVELEYFHSILKEIIGSDNHKISFIVCINITSTLTGVLSRENGQNVLQKWIDGGYFINQDGNIYLGLRTILEFTSYLKDHCPNSLCKLCSEIAFVGKCCAFCHHLFHSYCMNRYLQNQETCPNCNSNWQELEDSSVRIPLSQEINMEHEPEIEYSDTESITSQPGPSQRKIRRRH